MKGVCKMVYVFLANGFEEIEAITVIDVLRRGGAEVKTVSIGSESVVGSHGITVKCDLSEKEARESVDSSELEMIVFPGGMPGAANLDASETVEFFIEKAKAADAYMAAICAAPMILGKRGLLKGHDATCYPGFEEYLEGATHYDASVVLDGNFLTSNGPASALDFALQALSLLKGEAEADRIAEAMMT